MIGKIYSLFVVIHLTSSLVVDIPLQTYEFARGGNGTIPCNFKPRQADNPSVIISWTANPDNPADSEIEILTYYYFRANTDQVDVSDEFAGRASVLVDIAKGWANLTLTALSSKDSRVFQCDVKIPKDAQGKLSDTTSVVVLVAPSKPICAIQGRSEFYQNISLTCRSEEGTPTPTYRWQSYDVTNNPRPNPPKSTDVNGVLSLFNISTETSGYYICTSANKIRSETCNLTLSVMPYSMNLGSTAAIAGGCAAGLLVLVIICCCYRCRKKKAERYADGPPEGGEYTDKDPHELEELQEKRLESKADRRDEREEFRDDRQDHDNRQGRPDNRQYDSDRYDDRRSDYDDRRRDRYDDRRSDYDDRRSDYDDRRSDRYDDRRSDRYDDRRSDRYDDRRSDYDDGRRDRNDDRSDEPRDRYGDRRRDRYDDRRDH